jgi:membrane peptidoglycan carboxypeptidase
MARNRYIPASLAKRCQGEPIRVAPRPDQDRRSRSDRAHPRRIDAAGRGRFGIDHLFQGRIVVRSTVDARVQTIVNEALEHGLALYEKRHPKARGLIQGSVVVLRNADAAILAEAGGRRVYRDRQTRYSDYNRVTGSLCQPGSALKPLVYLAAFESGLDLDTMVPDEPIEVLWGGGRGFKQIANYDNQFKGPIPMRQALAESRNAVAVWITHEIGVNTVIHTARQMGIRTPLQPRSGHRRCACWNSADAYRAIASGVLAEPHIIESVTHVSPATGLYKAPRRTAGEVRSAGLARDSGGPSRRGSSPPRHGPQSQRPRFSDPSRCSSQPRMERHLRATSVVGPPGCRLLAITPLC